MFRNQTDNFRQKHTSEMKRLIGCVESQRPTILLRSNRLTTWLITEPYFNN